MTITCAYRFYPSWFGDADIMVPVRELAAGSAANMGRRVQNIEKIGSGFDGVRGRGHFVDYRITYSSTAAPAWEEIRG